MFGISATELRSYERGSALISDSVLARLFTYGLLMIARKNIKRKEQDS